MQDNITIPKEQLDLMVTKANMELIARLDTLITRLEQQHTKKEWVDLTEEDYVIINSLCERKLEAAEYAAHLLKEKNT